MKGKTIGYVRVSTIDQNPERQLSGLKLDKTFTEYASGKDTNRPQLKQLMEYVREDDQLYIHSLDRLARNVKDLKDLVDFFLNKKVTVHFVQQNLIFDDKINPMSNLLLFMMGAIAEFERELNLERQREGIAIAKSKGKYKGRKKILNAEKAEYIRQQMLTRKSKQKIAAEIGVSRTSMYKYLKELGIK